MHSRLLIPSKLLVLLTSIGLIGCSSKEAWHTDVVPVVGSVTVNGENPEGAIIMFHPVNGDIDARASRPSGLVTDDGTYQLTTYEYGDGAPPGDYVFTILWPQEPKMGGLSPDRMGRIYATPKASDLRITVPAEGGTLDPVVIEKVKITMKKSSSAGNGAPGPGH
ncbi:hypothetical protein AB1L30_22825 [Bremerella sp. JC817]|uniref:hypothetical protein n=1 Tax=Bremerella sp. JC817 TaxID=3231756 RepID=UPI003458DF62